MELVREPTADEVNSGNRARSIARGLNMFNKIERNGVTYARREEADGALTLAPSDPNFPEIPMSAVIDAVQGKRPDDPEDEWVYALSRYLVFAKNNRDAALKVAPWLAQYLDKPLSPEQAADVVGMCNAAGIKTVRSRVGQGGHRIVFDAWETPTNTKKQDARIVKAKERYASDMAQFARRHAEVY